MKVVCPAGSAGQGVYLSCEGAEWRSVDGGDGGDGRLNSWQH